MFRRKELDKLALEKRALVAESGLHRLAVQVELQNLRSATAWLSEATRWPRKLGPLLLVLAPLAGFLLAKGSRRQDSWFNRVTAAAKWIGPLYTLWRSFSASRGKPEAGEPAV
ncbi:MAG: hypothetical protein ACLQU3_06165 [Limisphaerales bacterium]